MKSDVCRTECVTIGFVQLRWPDAEGPDKKVYRHIGVLPHKSDVSYCTPSSESQSLHCFGSDYETTYAGVRRDIQMNVTDEDLSTYLDPEAEHSILRRSSTANKAKLIRKHRRLVKHHYCISSIPTELLLCL
jgi:hypothetical protein